MNKEKYIEQELLGMIQSLSGMLFLLGSAAILSLSILDYFVTPENFVKFLIYRIIAASLYIPLFFTIKLKKEKTFLLGHIFLAALIVSTMVEVMVLSFGGHQSPYYAGMIIVFVFLFGLLPISLKLSSYLALLIYFIYLVPILIFDEITNVRIFLNNNIFLIAIFFSGLNWRHFNYKTHIRMLSLQYDLEQQKKQLENHSVLLEGMVEERTKELNKSEQRHRALFENAMDGIVVLDQHGIIVNANDKACEMHGFAKDALIGAHIKIFEDHGNLDEMAKRMRRILEGESLVFETIHNKKDGTPLHLEISSKAISIANELFVQSFYRDITEKRKFREHILQSQKMESVGVLAGGIAHDFNNILSAIMGHVEVVRLQTSLEARSLRSLQVIEDASRKAGTMISKLLGFARKSSFEILPLYLNDVIHDTIKLLERVIDKNVSLTVELDPQLPVIQGDFNQLEQIIMNLIVNARDAMPQGGRIDIKTQYRNIIPGMTDVPPYILPGEYVLLSVVDTGCGIPEHVIQRIYEPFFTTKERGKGTGLGLSMVYGAVKEHKGYITVESRPGEGSTFVVYLPVSRAAVSWAGSQLETLARGKEMILFVDDEEDVLSAIRETLTTHGYKVLTASDPALALDLFTKMPREIALVITDMVMPKIDGKELIKRMLAINPETKILAVSGYMKYVAEKADIREIAGFLQKPFESRHLLSMIRKILDTRPNTHTSINV